MDNQEKSLKFFNECTRNENEFDGSIVLYSKSKNAMIRVNFGSGDNLDDDDIAKGYDDYLNIDMCHLDGSESYTDIVRELYQDDLCLDEVDGLVEDEGGCLLFKQDDYVDGDIRRHLINALEFIGYGEFNEEEWKKDLVFVVAY